MSDYAEKRIKDALKQAKGNKLRARQQVIAWTFEDSRLLYDLTKSHLNGIVAYNIERVASGRADKAKTEPPPPPPPQDVNVSQGEEFGMEILKAVANSSAQVFGLEGGGAPARRGKASKQHVDAIRRMAKKPPTEQQ